MKIYFYEKGLENFKDVKIRKAELYDINAKSFFIIDKEYEKFYLYLSGGKYIQELPFEHYKSTVYGGLLEVGIFEVNVDGEKVSFYVNSETKEVLFTPYSSDYNTRKMPFLKKDYATYQGYDIEWTGDNYQVSDYFTKIVVSLSPCLEEVHKDIDQFLEWKSKIPTNREYYEKLGFTIEVVPSGERYSAFPYTYEIGCPNGELLSFTGISNVFETEEEALLKACYKCNNIWTYNHF